MRCSDRPSFARRAAVSLRSYPTPACRSDALVATLSRASSLPQAAASLRSHATPAQPLFYYPDLLVTCHGEDRERSYSTRPCLIVEELSENTERIDRREKLLAYRTLPSLQEYLLAAQDERQVTVYGRTGSCSWPRSWVGAMP